MAASAAVDCQQRSLEANEALLVFPVDPELPDAAAPVETEVLLQGIVSPANIPFGVPAAFFYALGSSFDKSMPAYVRYQSATGETVDRLLHAIDTAVKVHVIKDEESFTNPPSSIPASSKIHSIQAARRLVALGVSSVTSSSPTLTLPASGRLADLVTAWLAVNASPAPNQPYQPEQEYHIWSTLGNHSAPQDRQRAYLDLVLAALTQSFRTPSGSLLADEIAQWLPSTTIPPTTNPTVTTLKAVTAARWTDFFSKNPTWLPPFTQPGHPAAQSSLGSAPGYIATRIRAFIRAVQRFFTVSSAPNPAAAPDVGGPPTFDLPESQYDLIKAAVNAYPGLVFGITTLSDSDPVLEAAVGDVFQADPDPVAEAWLAQAITWINELYLIASDVKNIDPGVTPIEPSLRFSVMEALYARGFRSAKDITALTGEDFTQALIGTVAYDHHDSLYTQALNIVGSAPVFPIEGNGTFQPINPGGRLTNCIPPLSISPLGPAAYLQELLKLSKASTCEKPFVAPASGQTTLADAVAARRGPVGNLLASCANLETPLPLIDIVNECLEFMAATVPAATSGTVYNTESDQLVDHKLCKEKHEHEHGCHDPARLFATLPEHSSPATPVEKPDAYKFLKNDFSSCRLPYSQPLDVSRSYLRHLRTSRYEVMRTFRKDITEFLLDPDPAHQPDRFQAYLWRYPVRLELAWEYLGITPEEYSELYSNDSSQMYDLLPRPLQRLIPSSEGVESLQKHVYNLEDFLAATCLTYCELVELNRARFVDFWALSGEGGPTEEFPDCEPCCLERYAIWFPPSPEPLQSLLRRLMVFIRLWRTLRHVAGARYSFQELAAICSVLKLFHEDGTINPDFIRQLAAFQMLRDDLGLPLAEPRHHPADTPPAQPIPPAQLIPLLALWTDDAEPAAVDRVTHHLLEHIVRRAQVRHGCRPHAPEFIKLLAENLQPLARLAGFGPKTSADSWQALPTHTLRFAEVLIKICASDWGVGEILYLFTNTHLDGEDPFPLEEANEVLDLPLDLPDDDEHSLWELRRKLLSVEVSEEEACEWTWTRIEASLRGEFGYEPKSVKDDSLEPKPVKDDPLRSLGNHFFPGVVEACGGTVDPKERRYHVLLKDSSDTLWNVPPEGPFRYKKDTGKLWTQLPLCDQAVIDKLSHSRPLTPEERGAAQDLYFLPRIDLAPFAFLFPSFADADHHLIQEPDESRRWAYFRRHFALTRALRRHRRTPRQACHGRHRPAGVRRDGSCLAAAAAPVRRREPSGQRRRGSLGG